MKNNEELRLYSFNHYKLQGIHAGIQCQHATQEMNNKYPNSLEIEEGNLWEWADKWKTTIILNGGNSRSMKEIKDLLNFEQHDCYWSYFKESEDDMEGILTNIVIVVPESIFNMNVASESFKGKGGFFGGDPSNFTEFEIKLAELIQSKPLMR